METTLMMWLIFLYYQVEQLSRHGDEEAILLTTTVADASFNHLGSTLTKGFLDSQKDIKEQFLVHCLKGIDFFLIMYI